MLFDNLIENKNLLQTVEVMEEYYSEYKNGVVFSDNKKHIINVLRKYKQETELAYSKSLHQEYEELLGNKFFDKSHEIRLDKMSTYFNYYVEGSKEEHLNKYKVFDLHPDLFFAVEHLRSDNLNNGETAPEDNIERRLEHHRLTEHSNNIKKHLFYLNYYIQNTFIPLIQHRLKNEEGFAENFPTLETKIINLKGYAENFSKNGLYYKTHLPYEKQSK